MNKQRISKNTEEGRIIGRGSTGGPDSFSLGLSESSDFFRDEYHINMVGQYGSHIASDEVLFENYMERLLQGVSSEDSPLIEQLCLNSRNELLSENQLAHIPPYSGYCLPTIVKIFSRCAMVNAIPTETPTKPTFSIHYKQPFIIDMGGNKHYLPEAVQADDNVRNEMPKLWEGFVNVPNTGNINLLTSTIVNGVACSKVKRDYINRILYIDAANVDVPLTAGGSESILVKDLKLQSDIKGNIYGVIEAVGTDNTVRDTVFGRVNFEDGTTEVASANGFVKSVRFFGHVSQAFQTSGETVSFEIVTKDIQIGEGSPLNAVLPYDFIKDNKAVYNIDAAAECVDILSQVAAQKIDQTLRHFMNDSFKQNCDVTEYTATYSAKPVGGFQGKPVDWREELKRVIEFWAIHLKTKTQLSQGYFAIVGNPNDIALLEGIDWQAKASTSENNGCRIEYEYGVMSGTNQYRIISSSLIPKGELIMFFAPTDDRYITYKYYPYSFDLIQSGYQNPNTPNIPNIMLTRRHETFDLLHSQVRIKIENNIGDSYGNYAL